MLTIDHYTGPARGKARGKWTFWAQRDGHDWEVIGRGRKVVSLRYWHREVGSDGVASLMWMPFSPSPPTPEVDAALVEYARAQIA